MTSSWRLGNLYISTTRNVWQDTRQATPSVRRGLHIVFWFIYIIAEAARVIIGDGHYRKVIAVNGSVPGPPIVVYHGQQVRWHVITSWHGNISALMALCYGNPPVTGGFPSQTAVARALIFFFMLAQINCWTNSPVTGDFRRQGAHLESH